MFNDMITAYHDEISKKTNEIMLEQMESYGYSLDWLKEYGRERCVIATKHGYDGTITYTVAVDMKPLFQVVVISSGIEVEETPEGPTYRMVNNIYTKDLTGRK